MGCPKDGHECCSDVNALRVEVMNLKIAMAGKMAVIESYKNQIREMMGFPKVGA
jgi:hypothetical protein